MKFIKSFKLKQKKSKLYVRNFLSNFLSGVLFEFSSKDTKKNIKNCYSFWYFCLTLNEKFKNNPIIGSKEKILKVTFAITFDIFS
jgi:hypothetical protein